MGEKKILKEAIKQRLNHISQKYGKLLVPVTAIQFISIILCVFLGILFLQSDDDDTILLLVKLLQVPIVLLTNLILVIIALINSISGIIKKNQSI